MGYLFGPTLLVVPSREPEGPPCSSGGIWGWDIEHRGTVWYQLKTDGDEGELSSPSYKGHRFFLKANMLMAECIPGESEGTPRKKLNPAETGTVVAWLLNRFNTATNKVEVRPNGGK